MACVHGSACSSCLLMAALPQALLQFDYTFPDTPEEQQRMDSVKLPCHLNLAACKLHQQEYDEVYIQCRLVRTFSAFGGWLPAASLAPPSPVLSGLPCVISSKKRKPTHAPSSVGPCSSESVYCRGAPAHTASELIRLLCLYLAIYG